MDDLEFQPAEQRIGVFAKPRNAKNLLEVGYDNTTGERLLQDRTTKALFMQRHAPAWVDGRLQLVEQQVQCTRLQYPELLQVLISGIYGGPPMPILATFEGGVTKPINVDALRL